MGLMDRWKSGGESKMQIQEGVITGVKVSACALGEKYTLPGGAVGEYTGSSRDVGFFQTDAGTVKLTLESLVQPSAPPAAAITPPATQAPAASPAPVGPATGISEIAPAPAAITVTVSGGLTPAAVIPPDAPKSNPALAAEPPPAAVEEKKKRGPKPPESKPADALKVYVDCVPNKPAQSLATYIGEIIGAIEKSYEVPDIRLAPKKTKEGNDHPLAFGNWRGVLALAIRTKPPAPGTYVVIGTAGSELAQVAAEALEQLPGIDFTRGVA